MTKQKVIIDTDPGVDDAMAILFACLCPQIELLGLTSIFGNVTTDIATRNALALLEMADCNLPVARGLEAPIVQEAKPVAWEVHGKEGFGDVPAFSPTIKPVEESAAHFICRMADEYPAEIVLCAVGPLTNIAAALKLDPTITQKIKSVAIMGGSLDEGGNVTSFAEANIWQDPHAAEMVFAANWEVTMVGLDVTHQIICTPEDMKSLVGPAPNLGGFLNEAAQFYFEFHRKENGIRGCHMHDPTAVISIIRPDLFSIDKSPVDVILKGEEIGRTIRSGDASRPALNVCMGVNANEVRELFLETLKTGF